MTGKPMTGNMARAGQKLVQFMIPPPTGTQSIVIGGGP
jgi:hypothetical protein